MKRLLLLACAAALLVGCATSRGLVNLSPQEWAAELRARHVDPAATPNPLEATAEMRLKAVQLAGIGTSLERLRRLQDGLFDSAQFPFTYDTRETFTAAEAFYRREGNCLSFTNLFAALARSIGLPVTTALVLQIRGSEQEGDLIVVNTHVVAMFSDAGKDHYFDFSRSQDRHLTAVRPLDDLWVTALYLNNRGADELRAGHNQAALDYFENTVKLAPDFAAGWGNLGVARRRVGDTASAFDAYHYALELEPDNPTILANLAALYSSMGRSDEAAAALSAANLSKASAHTLVVRGYLELTRGRPSKAMSLFRRARRMAPTAPEPLLALARAELNRSRRDKAIKYLEKALHVHPDYRPAQVLLERLQPKPVPTTKSAHL